MLTWWSPDSLGRLLTGADEAIKEEARWRRVLPDRVPAFLGGGAPQVYDGPFFIFNRKLLEELVGVPGSDPQLSLDSCRHRLCQCLSNNSQSGSSNESNSECEVARKHHKRFAKPGAMYNWGHLVSYCTYPRRQSLLLMVSADFLHKGYDSTPAFVQNGNTWADAKSLVEGWLNWLPQVYMSCIVCDQVTSWQDEYYPIVLRESFRTLVTWHHSNFEDALWLERIAQGDENSTAEAIKYIRLSALKSQNQMAIQNRNQSNQRGHLANLRSLQSFD